LRIILPGCLKMPRDEHQTRVELINPALHERGWVEALIREEKTPGGTDIIDGKPRKRKGRTDYLLCIPVMDGKPPLAVALLEAKAEDKLPSLGIQQAKDYMKKFQDTSTIHYRYRPFRPPKSLKRDMKLSKVCIWILKIQKLC
jgi:type I site-specific restriction endonuclease